MKRKNKGFIICACFLLLFGGNGCSSSDDPDITIPREEPEEELKEPVEFTVSLDGIEMTKANIEGRAFEVNDKFQFCFNSYKPIESHTQHVRVYEMKTKDNWQPENDTMYWDNQEIRLRHFCAFTPYAKFADEGSHGYGYTFGGDESDANQFTVKQDQSTEANYKASDLLIARAYTKKRLVPLSFYHVLSKVRVTVSASTKKDEDPNGWFTVAEFTGLTVKLNNMAMKADLTFNPIEEDSKDTQIIATGNLGDNKAWKDDITMCPLNATPEVKEKVDSISCSFIAIIPPLTTLSTNDKLLSIKISGEKGKTYIFTPDLEKLPEGGFTQQGKETSIHVVLKKRDVLAELETNIEITAWGEGSKATDNNPITLK
ncbi:fimbrillin family protein [Parabacteroides sp. OttesenSCG-928-G07]|nr:fimbrillin family protein [Parabacteroides sp. OttesenSCG-928-G07]